MSDASVDDVPDRPTGDLVAWVECQDDGPDECTIAPADAEGRVLMTHWLTAVEGSFVSLAAMR